MRSRGRFRSTAWAALVAVASSVALAMPGTPAGAIVARAQADAASTTCARVSSGFTPATLSIRRVVRRTRVLALGRDQQGVPLTPPLTDRGKWQFAWDQRSGIRPGDPRGVVRLTAHTYPRDGSHGAALGNLLLRRLRIGARIEVSGHHGERLCYRVVRRVDVRAERSLPGYYSSTGPSRLAILVCSGRRRGPGDWSHRTIWYAEPTRASTSSAEGS